MKRCLIGLMIVTLLAFGCGKKQGIEGIWKDTEGIEWRFGIVDGELWYCRYPESECDTYKYNYFDGKERASLTIYSVPYATFAPFSHTPTIQYSDQVFYVEFSKDGKSLSLTGGNKLPNWSGAGPGMGNNVLTRVK